MKQRFFNSCLVMLVAGISLLALPAYAMDEMSDKQLENVYARNAADAQIAANPVSEVTFHNDNAISPVSQAAGDVQMGAGAASTLGGFAGPPAIIQQSVNDVQEISGGVTMGLGGIF